MVDELGVGIVGAGRFGTQHAQVLSGVPGARLVAASARTKPRLARFVEQFGGRGFLDYHDLIDEPAVDAVCITLPHHLHAEATVAAAKAGKAILLEKPMATTLADCDAIVEVIRTTSVPFMVGYTSRFMRAYVKAAEHVRGGLIGRPILGTAAMVKDWRSAHRQRWQLESGGGMWMTNGCHLIDRLCLLFNANPDSVSAIIGSRFHAQESDDVGIGLIGFDGGEIGVVRAVGYSAGARDDWTEVNGTNAALRISHKDGLYIGRDDRWEPILTGPSSPLAALHAEWWAFIRHASGQATSPLPAEYGWMVSAAVLAGVASSETGEVVPVRRQVPTPTEQRPPNEPYRGDG